MHAGAIGRGHIGAWQAARSVQAAPQRRCHDSSLAAATAALRGSGQVGQ
jgi:hypothetical protein